MSPSQLVGWPPSILAMAKPSLERFMNRKLAVPVAMALWLCVAAGHYLTRASVGFTLLYLIPLGIAVWWRGLRFGLLLALLSTVSFSVAWIGTTPIPAGSPRYVFILVWNLLGEIGVFLAFAIVLDGLRKRLAVEVKERESIVVQLRHADRLNTVGKLASGIAHELGTPLNVVSGRASLIASRRVEGEDACKSAEVIMQQADRMTAIIKNLLAFARRGGVRKTAVDLNRLVRETVSLLEPLAKKQGVELVATSGSPLVAPVNAGEIQQVLTNLIMNAVQAMPKGGTIQVQLSHGHYESAVPHGLAREPFAIIRVRDEGTGVAPDVLPHIFDPFFTTKDVGAGTGLGLSVSFGIVRDHGGWIEANTKLGEGTEFVVYLPEGENPSADPWSTSAGAR